MAHALAGFLRGMKRGTRRLPEVQVLEAAPKAMASRGSDRPRRGRCAAGSLPTGRGR